MSLHGTDWFISLYYVVISTTILVQVKAFVVTLKIDLDIGNDVILIFPAKKKGEESLKKKSKGEDLALSFSKERTLIRIILTTESFTQNSIIFVISHPSI